MSLVFQTIIISSRSDPTLRLLEIKHSMPLASELPLFSRELNRSNLPSEVGELEPVDIVVLDDLVELEWELIKVQCFQTLFG
jgi:hypothetical protein